MNNAMLDSVTHQSPNKKRASLIRVCLLSIRLLWRNWRSGEVQILAVALMLAVAVVTCIAVFTGRLEHTLVQQSHQFIGADRVVSSSQPIQDSWQVLADTHDVETASVTQFVSMVFADINMHLASVKAVSEGYPLLGELTISRYPFPQDDQVVGAQGEVPASGEAWVDSRLLPLLNIKLGDEIYVGEKALTVTRVVVDEPDRGIGFSVMGARVLMNEADLAATEVIQPGSRIDYRWLLKAEPDVLAVFIDELSPHLTSHEQLEDVESSQQNLAETLDTARKFLLLAAMIGVLLSGVAIAIAARRFASRHVEQIALMKSLGASAWRVRGLYAGQLLALGFIASAFGLLLGFILQWWISISLDSMLTIELGHAPVSAFGIGLVTGVVCLLGFVVPPLWHLPRVPPIKIMRREMTIKGVGYYWQAIIGLLAMLFLIAVFSQSLQITLAVTGALLALLSCCAAFALLLFKLGELFGQQVGSYWRLALASLKRNRQQNITQMMVFSLAVMLLLSLVSLSEGLINDWQQQLPPGSPNHFVMNIAPADTAEIQRLMSEQNLKPQPFYPMVRGRLTHINNALPSEQLYFQANVLNRESNLSWAEQLGDDNRLKAGDWWGEWQGPSVEGVKYGVSVEQEVAERLQITLGDQLRFSIGGLLLTVEVASIRELQWDSMNPNFYFLFSPGALDSYSPTLLTSVYVPPEQTLFVNNLLRDFPTLVVIDLGRVIKQIQSIVTQVGLGIQLMLWLTLVGGFVVMWAAVNASMDQRLQEAALMRALGSPRKRLLGSLWVEFSMLGFLAGVMAVVGAETLVMSMQKWMLDMPVSLHWELWLMGILGSTLVIGGFGVLACRRVITTPPGLILREIA